MYEDDDEDEEEDDEEDDEDDDDDEDEEEEDKELLPVANNDCVCSFTISSKETGAVLGRARAG